MNEQAARAATLVRAVETADASGTVWTTDDRAWAGRAAAEVVGAEAPADAFLARRAALAVERLTPRQPGVPRLLRTFAWRAWIGWAVPLAALALGAATDRLGPSHRVDVLAFPLLALVAWNLVAYVSIALRGLARLAGARRAGGALRSWIGRIGRIAPRTVPGALEAGPLGTAAAIFAADWARLAAPLWTARIARVLHASAALLALGAIAGLYLRGIVHEYRAGWDSTFLDADAVARLLSVALAPGAVLTGITLPDAARLEAMRFGAGGAGEPAADWIHLYAATIGVLVVLPRLLLALVARLLEWRRATRFALPLGEPYYLRLLQGLRELPMRARVIPYGFQPSEPVRLGLEALLARAFGPRTAVVHAPTVAYGAEDALRAAAPRAAAAGDSHADVVVALFNLTATPEQENHGAFVAALSAQSGAGSPPLAVVDESAFVGRFADQPRRLDERRDAWRQALASHRIEPVFVDLASPDAAASAAAALESALHRQGRA